MNHLTGCAVLIVAAVLAGLAAGCGTKSTAPAVAVDAKKLAGADEVMAAIARKDYDGAMAAWIKVKESVATEEQQTQFDLLTRELTSKMSEAAPTDPKAAEAEMALRKIRLGR